MKLGYFGARLLLELIDQAGRPPAPAEPADPAVQAYAEARQTRDTPPHSSDPQPYSIAPEAPPGPKKRGARKPERPNFRRK